MPDYLLMFLVFVTCLGVAALPWEALDAARHLPQRSPNEKE